MSARAVSPTGFAVRLRSVRLTRGLTLRAVSARTGFSIAFLSRLELGDSNPSVDTLERLADTLGFTMDWLWRGTEPDSRNGEDRP